MYLMFSLINFIAFCKYMRILKWLSVNTVRLQMIALSFYVSIYNVPTILESKS